MIHIARLFFHFNRFLDATPIGNGNYWRAFPFLENSFAPEGISNPHIACEAARAYGAFARALRNFPAHTLGEPISGFHDTDQRWQVFLKILDENPTRRAAETQSEIAAIFAAKPVFDEISKLKQSRALPLRVTHNDTKAGMAMNWRLKNLQDLTSLTGFDGVKCNWI